MLTINSRDKLRVREFESHINYDTRIYFDKKKLYKRVRLEESYYQSALYELTEYIFEHTGGHFSEPSRSNIITFLLKYCNVKDFYLLSGTDRYGNPKYSIDRKRKLDRVYADGYATEFLDLYFEYTELKSSKENIKKMMSRCETIIDPLTNRELLIVNFSYNMADTGRYCTYSENVQAIKKLYLDCIVAPPGKFLFWADFDQMDLRVAWNVLLSGGAEDDKLFDLYDDKYKALANIVCLSNDLKFNENMSEEERKKYKLSVLSRTYGCSLNSLKYRTGDAVFARNLDKYFKLNRRYSFYLDTINELIELGDSITISDYFGVQRVIANAGMKNGIRTKCLNTPIQSTSNSILISLVCAIMDKFKSLGFGYEDISVYLDRHDEIIFALSDRIKPYLYLFNDFMKVCIDDWSPLTLDPYVGYYYKVNDEGLTEYLNKPFKETERKPLLGKTYFPIKGEETLTAYIEDNKFLIRYDKLDRTFIGECNDNVILHFKRYIEECISLNSCDKCKVIVENYPYVIYNVMHKGVTYEYSNSSQKTLESVFKATFNC